MSWENVSLSELLNSRVPSGSVSQSPKIQLLFVSVPSEIIGSVSAQTTHQSKPYH